jgi:hypothetical protein
MRWWASRPLPKRRMFHSSPTRRRRRVGSGRVSGALASPPSCSPTGQAGWGRYSATVTTLQFALRNLHSASPLSAPLNHTPSASPSIFCLFCPLHANLCEHRSPQLPPHHHLPPALSSPTFFRLPGRNGLGWSVSIRGNKGAGRLQLCPHEPSSRPTAFQSTEVSEAAAGVVSLEAKLIRSVRRRAHAR